MSYNLTINASTIKKPENSRVKESLEKNLSPTLKKISIPPEIIYAIFSFLDCKNLARASLVCKAMYAISNDIHLPCYQWILQSDFVRQLDAKKQPPLICYEGGKLTPTSCHALLQTYGLKNHFDHFLRSLRFNSKGKIEISSSLLETLLLAVKQGSLPARKIAEELFDKFDDDLQYPLVFLKELADAGSEKAIKKLLRAHLEGDFGLNEHSLEVQQKALRLIEEYVKKGSSSALDILDDIYEEGWAGLNSTPSEVQVEHKKLLENLPFPYQGEGFQKVKKLADEGNPQAIKNLLRGYIRGRFGNEPKIIDEGIKLTCKYAEEGSSYAVKIILQNSRDERLARLYADKGVVVAMDYLIKGYQFGYWDVRDVETQLELHDLVKKYAHQGSEIAIQRLLDLYLTKKHPRGVVVFESYGDTLYRELLNIYLTSEIVDVEKEGLKLAKEFADKGSEIAIRKFLYYLKKENDNGNYERLASRYADQGSEIARLKYLKHLFKTRDKNPLHFSITLHSYLQKGSSSSIKFLVNHCILSD